MKQVFLSTKQNALVRILLPIPVFASTRPFLFACSLNNFFNVQKKYYRKWRHKILWWQVNNDLLRYFSNLSYLLYILKAINDIILTIYHFFKWMNKSPSIVFLAIKLFPLFL